MREHGWTVALTDSLPLAGVHRPELAAIPSPRSGAAPLTIGRRHYACFGHKGDYSVSVACPPLGKQIAASSMARATHIERLKTGGYLGYGLEKFLGVNAG